MPLVSSFVLMLAACSKEKMPMDDKPQTASVPSTKKDAADQPVLTEAKTKPIVSPGHLPPNPKVPQGSPVNVEASLKHRYAELPGQQSQPAPAGKAEALPTTVNGVHTPDQGNQARLQALQEMYRLKNQKGAPTQTGGAPAIPEDGTPETTSVPTKTQP